MGWFSRPAKGKLRWIMGKDSSRLCQGLRGYPFYQWTRNGKLKSNSRLRSSSRSWSHWETCGQEAFRQPGEPHTLYCAAARPRRQRSMVLTIRSALHGRAKAAPSSSRKEDLPAIRKQLKNYESLKTLVDRWIDLATELSNLRITQKTNLNRPEKLSLSSS
jgi:hypothetical protein